MRDKFTESRWHSRIGSLLILIAVLGLSSATVFYHYQSIKQATLDASKKQFIYLLSLKDYPEVSRQLNSLVESENFTGYELFEDSKKRPQLKNTKYLNNFESYRSFALSRKSTFNLKDSLKGVNARLVVHTKLPLWPFAFIFILFSTIYLIYIYFLKNVEIGTREETSRSIIHNIESRAKALSGLIKDMKTSGCLADKDGIVENLSQGIIDTLYNERRKHIFYRDKNQKMTHFNELVDYLISYKRVELNSHDIKIESEKLITSEASFLKIMPSQLDSILSNMINNSVHACRNVKGEILIKLVKNKDQAEILVIDNGEGISEEDKSSIFKKSYSNKNKRSTGIGLYHAKKILESIGGSIEVKETSSTGTIFSLMIPIAESPRWFVDKIDLSEIDRIVIVDDEEFSHNEWKNTLKRFEIDILSFDSLEKVKDWIEKGTDLKSTLFLIDNDFGDIKSFGLSFIKDMSIADKSILVTNTAYDEAIKKECRATGLRLMHKKHISEAKFTKKSYEKKFRILKTDKVILLDDDKMISRAWEKMAGAEGFNISTYKEPQSLLTDLDSYSPENTVIFYDENLGEHNPKGGEINVKASKKGFKSSFCITGYSEEKNIYEGNQFLAVLNKSFPSNFFSISE